MPPPEPRPGFAELFAGVPVAVLVVGPDDRIAHANAFAEQLLHVSERLLAGQPVDTILPPSAVERHRNGPGFAIYDTKIVNARGHRAQVDIAEAELADFPGWRVISLHMAATARRFRHAGEGSGGARAAIGAAAMLAHEIKNPLSGIRGAAQLLGRGELTELITTEVDRIAALIDRMQDFTDARPPTLGATNIYPLLMHARCVATAGFASGMRIGETFDPSLPPALVDRDALTQIVLNLLKNAVEAVAREPRPDIRITTAYRHGLTVSREDCVRTPLPIEICVTDNGPGAPPDIVDHLFEPFVSGRREGQGLGLALVDKLVRDMGGIVQYGREGDPERTVLRLLLPRATA